ncbi:MAG TPA: hypothetical protein ENK99_07460, partial [Campylobacterales bacterium]|nr:hypothetical protein [Campylobacterales bacterium]
DEIHYQKDFANDLKTIYYFFDIKVLFSGSSAIALSNADLSRRAVVYTLPVLSFREFIELKEKINFPTNGRVRDLLLTKIIDNLVSGFGNY